MERKLPIKLHKFSSIIGVVGQRAVSKGCRQRIKKKLVKQVWASYLDILKQELLEKGEIKLPRKIGSLVIYKYPIEKFPKYMEYVSKGMRKPESTNISRINYVYRIKYVRGEKIMWVRFSSSKGLKDELKKILNETEKDYKPAPLRIKK